jgi:hypothetical protein
MVAMVLRSFPVTSSLTEFHEKLKAAPDKRLRILIPPFWAHFLLCKKPGYPLQFLDFASGEVCGISASIPCAFR